MGREFRDIRTMCNTRCQQSKGEQCTLLLRIPVLALQRHQIFITSTAVAPLLKWPADPIWLCCSGHRRYLRGCYQELYKAFSISTKLRKTRTTAVVRKVDGKNRRGVQRGCSPFDLLECQSSCWTMNVKQRSTGRTNSRRIPRQKRSLRWTHQRTHNSDEQV